MNRAVINVLSIGIFFAAMQMNATLAQSTQEFASMPAGELEAGGSGQKSPVLFLPGIRFPLEKAPAYLNSQKYRPGGDKVPPGSQCDNRNYSYPWYDNFCEVRGWKTPLCPTSTGHQGQDIRPASCSKNTHWVVAAEDGIIASIGTFSITLLGESGTIYRYLHVTMTPDKLAVRKRDRVSRGDKLSTVSNTYNGTPTTIHLHFEAKATVNVNGKRVSTFVPPYSSLVDAYKRLLAGSP